MTPFQKLIFCIRSYKFLILHNLETKQKKCDFLGSVLSAKSFVN